MNEQEPSNTERDLDERIEIFFGHKAVEEVSSAFLPELDIVE